MMIKQGLLLLAVATVCLGHHDGKTNFHSKKSTFQEQSKYPSVASFHSTKTAQPAQPQPQIKQAPISFSQPQIQQAPISFSQPQIQQAPIPYAQPQPEPRRAPSPYSFGYEAEGSSRQESSDASGKVKGSYKVTNEDGSVRVVNYVADENGFRADIDTNEPGTKSDNPANVVLKSAAVEKPYQAPAAPSKYATQSFSQKTSKTRFEQKPVQLDLGGYNAPSQAQFMSTPIKQQSVSHNFGQASSHQKQSQMTHYAAPTAFKQERIQQTSFSDSKPVPYAFSYDAQLEDGSSSRSESSDASGKVVGQYSLTGADGRNRIVKYEADHEGFRASVDTNEFGTHSDSPANAQFHSSAPQEAPASPMYSAHSRKTAPVEAFKVQQTKLSSGSSIKSVNQAPVMSYQGQSSIQYSSSAAQEKPQPYSFNYAADLDDGSISRSENADGSGKVIGSYSLSVADGRKRTVDYLADHEGFRASVNTNEFGTKAESPADVQFYSSATEDEPAPYSSPNSYKASSSSMYSQSAIKQQPIQFNMNGGNGAYSYNYQASLEDGGSSAHSESSDGSLKVSGYYSLSAPGGGRRKVDYTADSSGFQASVDTNEFGTKGDSPAHATFKSSASHAAPEAPRAPVAYKMPAPADHQAFGSVSMGKTSYISQQRVEPVQTYEPAPYAFNYDAEATGGSSSRKESADANGVVTGSYEVRNEDGSVRVVEYIADKDGFRANVKTNEAGTKSDSPADVIIKSDAPVAPLEQKSFAFEKKLDKTDFPARSQSQKTSMFSQQHIEAWSR